MSPVSPQKVKEANDRLLNLGETAKAWLFDRGITLEMIQHYRLGAVRTKVGKQHLWAISIPIPIADGTAYYQKETSGSVVDRTA
ncbi:hypothetical protein HC928_19910 [bacterium]|nr:hypothetical protein [bacterium]